MADVTITGLPGGTTPSGSELIVLDQGGSTVRLSLSDIFLQGGEETLTSFSYDNNTNVFSYIAEDGNSSDINFGDEFLTQEIGTDWNTGTPQGNDKLYIKNIGAHTDYDPIGSGSDVDSNNNYFLDKDEFSLVISDNDNSTDGPNSHVQPEVLHQVFYLQVRRLVPLILEQRLQEFIAEAHLELEEL
jgi:hypothetical protein